MHIRTPLIVTLCCPSVPASCMHAWGPPCSGTRGIRHWEYCPVFPSNPQSLSCSPESHASRYSVCGMARQLPSPMWRSYYPASRLSSYLGSHPPCMSAHIFHLGSPPTKPISSQLAIQLPSPMFMSAHVVQLPMPMSAHAVLQLPRPMHTYLMSWNSARPYLRAVREECGTVGCGQGLQAFHAGVVQADGAGGGGTAGMPSRQQ